MEKKTAFRVELTYDPSRKVWEVEVYVFLPGGEYGLNRRGNIIPVNHYAPVNWVYKWKLDARLSAWRACRRYMKLTEASKVVDAGEASKHSYYLEM